MTDVWDLAYPIGFTNCFAAKPPLPKYWLSCILAQYHRKGQLAIQAFTRSVSFQECTALACLLPKNWVTTSIIKFSKLLISVAMFA